MIARRGPAIVLVVGGLLIVVGTFLPWVRSGPCCVPPGPQDFTFLEREGGWTLIPAGVACAVLGVIEWRFITPRRILGVLASISAVWAALLVLFESLSGPGGTERYEPLLGRYVLYPGVLLAILGALILTVTAPPFLTRTSSDGDRARVGPPTEAEHLFATQLERWRRESWIALKQHLNDPVAYELVGGTGVVYQFELMVFWDDRRGGDLRVIFTGDDGEGWRSRGMRSDDFIKAPDDSFVGE